MENKDIEIFYRINLSINYSTIAQIYSVKLTYRKILGILGRMNKILLLCILIKQNINERRPLVISFYVYFIKVRKLDKWVMETLKTYINILSPPMSLIFFLFFLHSAKNYWSIKSISGALGLSA